jgi:branched-chain amino acid transport system permease protein
MVTRLSPRHSLLAIAAAGAICLPFVADEYRLLVLTQCLIFAIAAVSLDAVWGYVGILDLGHSVWFGIGALGVGVMTTQVSPTGMVLQAGGTGGQYVAGVGLGMLAAASLAGLVGWYALAPNLSHFYIAVVGLAMAMTAIPLYSQFPSWTGGENGLFGFAYDKLSTTAWFYVAGAVFTVVVAGLHVLVRSDFGLLLRAIRDNERRARYLGFNVEGVKIAMLCCGAALGALAGGLYASSVGAVSASLFGFLFATELLVWVAVGGRGTLFGPALAAMLLTLAGSELNRSFPTAWGLLIGLLFIVIVIFLPQGLYPRIVRLLGRRIAAPISRRLNSVPSPVTVDAMTEVPVLSVRGLHFGYGPLKVLRGIDLSIHAGELLCIIGPNGAGKSTLIEVLTDGRRSREGIVDLRLRGTAALTGVAAHRIARAGVVRKFQVPALFPSLSVAEHVLLASCQGRLPSFWRRTRRIDVVSEVVQTCTATGLLGREDEAGGNLAHGLKQGLEIAMAVATGARVLLMDEPTAGLGGNERHVVGEILRKLAKTGRTVVLVEHDIDFVLAVADRLAVLHDGRVLIEGEPREVVRARVVREAYLGAAATAALVEEPA